MEGKYGNLREKHYKSVEQKYKLGNSVSTNIVIL